MGEFELKILLSLLSLGLFGGFSHCGFMCGPFVLMQVNNNLKNIKIENITYLKKLRGLALLPYHFGRITTYSFIGFLSSFIGKNIRESTNFHLASAVILFTGSLLILSLILKNFNINLFASLKIKSPKFFLLIKKAIPTELIDFLFTNPTGFNGYILGVILGFIPCGLLYSAIIISASLDNHFLAAFGMFLFGITTIPALFITAIGSFALSKNLKFGSKIFSQFMLLINMIVLFIMAASQIQLI